MRTSRTHLPATQAALQAMGAQIAIARRDLGWTVQELAERLGSSRSVVGRIERGAPGTSVGTVFEAAVLCGVPLFGADAARLPGVADQLQGRLALLPQRVHRRPVEVDDAF